MKNTRAEDERDQEREKWAENTIRDLAKQNSIEVEQSDLDTIAQALSAALKQATMRQLP